MTFNLVFENQPLYGPQTYWVGHTRLLPTISNTTVPRRSRRKFQSLPVNMAPKHIKWVKHACYQHFQVPRTSMYILKTLRSISQVQFEGMLACGRMNTFAAPFRRLFHSHREHYKNMLRISFWLHLSWAPHDY